MKNIRIGQRDNPFYWNQGIGMSGLAQVTKNMGLTIQEVIIIKISTTNCSKAGMSFQGSLKEYS